MTENYEIRKNNCQRACQALRENGFFHYSVFGDYQQLNVYTNDNDVFTYMCRSQKILCKTLNEDGLTVMKWCGEVGIGALLRKIGIDYHEEGEVEQINIIDFINEGDIQ